MSVAEPVTRVDERVERHRHGAPRLGWLLALVGLFVAAFVLRLVGLKTGLPYVYNADENSHFVPRAVGMFGHSLNPDYFINPPAFTYVIHALFAVRWGTDPASVGGAFAADPTDGVHARARRVRVPRRARRPADRDRRRAAVRGPPRRRRRRRAAGGRVPARPLQPLRVERRADAGAAGAVPGRRRRASTAPAARASTCSPGVALGVAIATKYTAGIVLVTVIAAAFASPVAHARVRNLAFAIGADVRRLRRRQPVRAARPPHVLGRDPEADRDRRRGRRQARAGQLDGLDATTSARSRGASAGCRRCSRSAASAG